MGKQIKVVIETNLDAHSYTIAAGFVAALAAIFKVANKWAVFSELEERYGKANADYLSGLLPTIGKVQSVEFVAPAAGEERKGEEVMLHRDTEAFSRAAAIVRFRLHPPTPHKVASWWIKLYPSTNTLVCWVLTSKGLETPFSDVLDESDIRHILQGLEEEYPI